MPMLAGKLADPIQFKVEMASNGEWTAEFAIPWKTLGITPKNMEVSDEVVGRLAHLLPPHVAVVGPGHVGEDRVRHQA